MKVEVVCILSWAPVQMTQELQLIVSYEADKLWRALQYRVIESKVDVLNCIAVPDLARPEAG